MGVAEGKAPLQHLLNVHLKDFLATTPSIYCKLYKIPPTGPKSHP